MENYDYARLKKEVDKCKKTEEIFGDSLFCRSTDFRQMACTRWTEGWVFCPVSSRQSPPTRRHSCPSSPRSWSSVSVHSPSQSQLRVIPTPLKFVKRGQLLSHHLLTSVANLYGMLTWDSYLHCWLNCDPANNSTQQVYLCMTSLWPSWYKLEFLVVKRVEADVDSVQPCLQQRG